MLGNVNGILVAGGSFRRWEQGVVDGAANFKKLACQVVRAGAHKMVINGTKHSERWVSGFVRPFR